MGEFKKGDFVRRTSNGSLTSTFGSHDKGFVGQIDDIVYRGGTTDIIFTNGHEGIITEYEPWQPRVGERVRVVRAELSHKADRIGLEFNVTHESYKVCNGVQTWGGDNAGGYVWRADELEPILAATPKKPTTLKIEAGRFYKTRDGRKVGPMSRWSELVEHPWEQQGGSSVFDKCGDIWREDGTSEYGVPPLIAEWIDESVAKPSNDNAQPRFKVGDRVVLTADNPQSPSFGVKGAIGKIGSIEGESARVTFETGPHAGDFWYVPISVLAAYYAPAVKNTTIIVALIENGQPKPSSTPHVHTSAGAAEKEAKRLAAKFKGQQFGVFTLTTTHHEPKPVYDHKWQNMAALGLKIDAIKELQALAGIPQGHAARIVGQFAA